MTTTQKKVVYLGLSGGVDSAVAAALLLEQGYDVIPVFLKCWEDSDRLNLEHGISVASDCPWEEDQKAALAVAEQLGIAEKFRSWNFSEEFFETVVQYLVAEAREGRTGNPDVVCNRTVKFGAFLKRALLEGADFVATGHYARVREHGDMFELLRPKCEAKNDQTYFLWQLNQEQLSHTLFPIGEFENKDAVRQEARRRGLPSAERKSTRGICFISPKEGYAGFLQRFLPEQKGEVVTVSGRVVGEHHGTAFYTLGQRQGIGVGADGGPYYVVEKDAEKNQLVVAAPADSQQLWRERAAVTSVSWISGEPPQLPLECQVFIRHPQSKTVSARVVKDGIVFQVEFAEPQWAPTPGQSIVFYDGDVVLGGGVIQ